MLYAGQKSNTSNVHAYSSRIVLLYIAIRPLDPYLSSPEADIVEFGTRWQIPAVATDAMYMYMPSSDQCLMERVKPVALGLYCPLETEVYAEFQTAEYNTVSISRMCSTDTLLSII